MGPSSGNDCIQKRHAQLAWLSTYHWRGTTVGSFEAGAFCCSRVDPTCQDPHHQLAGSFSPCSFTCFMRSWFHWGYQLPLLPKSTSILGCPFSPACMVRTAPTIRNANFSDIIAWPLSSSLCHLKLLKCATYILCKLFPSALSALE